METLEIGLENKGNAFALGPWPLFIEEVGGGNLSPYRLRFTNYMGSLDHMGLRPFYM
jgi:hypothetical protein